MRVAWGPERRRASSYRRCSCADTLQKLSPPFGSRLSPGLTITSRVPPAPNQLENDELSEPFCGLSFYVHGRGICPFKHHKNLLWRGERQDKSRPSWVARRNPTHSQISHGEFPFGATRLKRFRLSTN